MGADLSCRLACVASSPMWESNQSGSRPVWEADLSRGWPVQKAQLSRKLTSGSKPVWKAHLSKADPSRRLACLGVVLELCLSCVGFVLDFEG